MLIFLGLFVHLPPPPSPTPHDHSFFAFSPCKIQHIYLKTYDIKAHAITKIYVTRARVIELMPQMAYVIQPMPLNITKAYVVQPISLMAYFIQFMPLNINNGMCHLIGLKFYVNMTCVIEPMSLTIMPLRSTSLNLYHPSLCH
jgi:hypothetical protein